VDTLLVIASSMRGLARVPVAGQLGNIGRFKKIRFYMIANNTLTGDRKGTWSLTVTRNRRLTFRIDVTEQEVYDVDLEDYH